MYPRRYYLGSYWPPRYFPPGPPHLLGVPTGPFPRGYWASGYFATSYWPPIPGAPPVLLGVPSGPFPRGYWAGAYFPASYFPPAAPATGFSTTFIGAIQAIQDGTDYHIRWTSPSPQGTVFQVYSGRTLAWHGTDRVTTIPVPSGGRSQIQVGTVPPGMDSIDFSATLPLTGGTGDRALLGWLGGTFESASIASFRVYASPGPGLAVSYAKALATLPAYPGGSISDGFGLGGFGQGGFGRAASRYHWTSAPLASGVYQFAVRPVDAAGNETVSGSPASVTITARPLPPALNSSGKRLTYTYDRASRTATLAWLPSPG